MENFPKIVKNDIGNIHLTESGKVYIVNNEVKWENMEASENEKSCQELSLLDDSEDVKLLKKRTTNFSNLIKKYSTKQVTTTIIYHNNLYVDKYTSDKGESCESIKKKLTLTLKKNKNN